MADPVTAEPEEQRLAPVDRDRRPQRALPLLGRRDFRRAYLAVCASELGDAFQYVALMWFALVAGGPLGVLVVRLADSVPALIFGFHGGVAADRFDRKRLMVAADLVRAAVLVPVSIAGLTGHLPLWGLVVAAFVLTTAASYFAPAYGALLPTLVGRRNVQAANGVVRATADAASVVGWALAALLVALLPISTCFALNAGSFVLSAALLATLRVPARAVGAGAERPHVREGFAALRPLPALAVAVGVFGVAVTISSGTWIVGVPELVRSSLGRGAGSFSLVAAAYAVGSIAAGAALARRPVQRKALASLAAWTLYLPAYGLFAVAGSLWVGLVGAACAGIGQGTAWVLVNAAAQEDVPDHVLGRVIGLISLVHRGAHATGLLLVGPLFAVLEPDAVFAAAAVALPIVGLGGVALAGRLASHSRP